MFGFIERVTSIVVNQKLLLSVFKATGAYSKYAIEMFVGIA